MQKILIVEDDPFLSKMYLAKLEETGYEVDTALDGEEALKKVGENPALSLVLLDIVLPKADGFEILGKIKSDPKLKNIKVILLSNLGQEEDVKKGMDLGADDYLIKAHFTPSEVIQKIKKFFPEVPTL